MHDRKGPLYAGGRGISEHWTNYLLLDTCRNVNIQVPLDVRRAIYRLLIIDVLDLLRKSCIRQTYFSQPVSESLILYTYLLPLRSYKAPEQAATGPGIALLD